MCAMPLQKLVYKASPPPKLGLLSMSSILYPKLKSNLRLMTTSLKQVIEAITEAARSGKIGDGFIVRGRIINII